MDELRNRVLRMFGEMGKETLDLHILFEGGGNDPQEREKVLSVVEALQLEGLLESRGNDFYALTPKGKCAARGS